MPSRREAVLTIFALLLSLVAFGVVFHLAWISWVSGVFFSVLAAGGTMLHADLERRNRQLVATQEEVRVLAASSERERIARDLHDLLGHTLTLVAVKADLATRLAERDPAAARAEMAQVATIAREALGEVRAAVTGMRGASLSAEMGRANAMLSAAGVEARVQAAPATLDPSGEAVLAMALREAVTNVIRHAGATCCKIDLGVDAAGLMRLCVSDDGAGGPIAEGSGLSGMRARLAAAGGALDVQSGRGGTRLLAMLPRPNRPTLAA
jgi:two-component system sensor histidine kinase DesK